MLHLVTVAFQIQLDQVIEEQTRIRSLLNLTVVGTQYATCCHSGLVKQKAALLKNWGLSTSEKKHASDVFIEYSTYSVACGGKHTYLVSKRLWNESTVTWPTSLPTPSFQSFESKYEASKTLDPADLEAYELLINPKCEENKEWERFLRKSSCTIEGGRATFFYSPVPTQRDLCDPVPTQRITKRTEQDGRHTFQRH
ncbi:hypothetical protein BT63DRAFT_194852 [Microthyrium microscopicum]|uniref:Uncharacterized protein n=1 Tax=Microthyrium microscopicum TaxID=703497 RepID=A0A6A6UJJ1_9PEZI|nr:hypothetical protein BT63DRAFT_194852 [Microthyrium microscopicum]